MQADTDSIEAIRRDLAKIAYQLSAVRLQLIARRHFPELKFRPDQARVPAGSAEGGRWTSDDGNGGLIPVANTRCARLPVDLRQEDARGGHAFRDHVAKNDAELKAEVQAATFDNGFVQAGLGAEGSFDSIESADNPVNRTLDRYPAQVEAVASGATDQAGLGTRFGFPTGKEAFRPNLDTRPYMRRTYDVFVLIRHDPKSPNGFRVHTAYPRNQSPG